MKYNVLEVSLLGMSLSIENTKLPKKKSEMNGGDHEHIVDMGVS